MSDKTHLIATGLSGMVGSRFAELYGHKYEFQNLDLTNNVDITDAKVVDSAVKSSSADTIIHLAAYTNVDQANLQQNDKQGPCYQINVIGTKNIVAAAKKYKKYLIHVSTDFVFSGNRHKPYNEDMPTDPIEWYGQTKEMAEKIVSQAPINWSIVRISFPFRANFPGKPDLVRKIIAGLQYDTLPPMFTDHIITPSFVDDLCKVFFMFTLKRPRGIWHATGSSFVSDYELAQIIKTTFNLPGTIREGSLQEYLKTAKRPYQTELKISNAKLQLELGNPMLDVASALQIMKTQM
jgi:dTDP-4-dehydrorhamnose reductase